MSGGLSRFVTTVTPAQNKHWEEPFASGKQREALCAENYGGWRCCCCCRLLWRAAPPHAAAGVRIVLYQMGLIIGESERIKKEAEITLGRVTGLTRSGVDEERGGRGEQSVPLCARLVSKSGREQT